jgi:hypothetical protein
MLATPLQVAIASPAMHYIIPSDSERQPVAKRAAKNSLIVLSIYVKYGRLLYAAKLTIYRTPSHILFKKFMIY